MLVFPFSLLNVAGDQVLLLVRIFLALPVLPPAGFVTASTNTCVRVNASNLESFLPCSAALTCNSADTDVDRIIQSDVSG